MRHRSCTEHVQPEQCVQFLCAVSGTRVPQQARGEERRERILRATLGVIGRSGIAAVTHRRVAEEAGVPLGSLTYWFATKDDLLREALRLLRRRGGRAAAARSARRSTTGADPAEIAERFADDARERGDGAEQIAQFELYLEAARNPALRDVAAASASRAYEEVAARRAARRRASTDARGGRAAVRLAGRRAGPAAAWRAGDARRRCDDAAARAAAACVATAPASSSARERGRTAGGRRSTSNHTRVPLVVAVDAPAGGELVEHPQAEAVRVVADVGVEARAAVADLDAREVVGQPRGEDDPVGLGQPRVPDRVRDDLGDEQADRVVEVRVQALADEQPACGAGGLRA